MTVGQVFPLRHRGDDHLFIGVTYHFTCTNSRQSPRFPAAELVGRQCLPPGLPGIPNRPLHFVAFCPDSSFVYGGLFAFHLPPSSRKSAPFEPSGPAPHIATRGALCGELRRGRAKEAGRHAPRYHGMPVRGWAGTRRDIATSRHRDISTSRHLDIATSEGPKDHGCRRPTHDVTPPLRDLRAVATLTLHDVQPTRCGSPRPMRGMRVASGAPRGLPPPMGATRQLAQHPTRVWGLTPSPTSHRHQHCARTRARRSRAGIFPREFCTRLWTQLVSRRILLPARRAFLFACVLGGGAVLALRALTHSPEQQPWRQ
jgi:hypothetical protein